MPDRDSGPVLVDVLDRVLDKGIVIDAAVRVSIAGIELLGVDARVVVASIETYLLHADTLAYTDMAAAPPRLVADSLPAPVVVDSLPPRPVAGSVAPPAAADTALPPGVVDDTPPPSGLYAEETDAADAAADRVLPPVPPIMEPPADEERLAAGDGPKPVEDG